MTSNYASNMPIKPEYCNAYTILLGNRISDNGPQTDFASPTAFILTSLFLSLFIKNV